MEKLFIFSSEPHNMSTQFYKVVIAQDKKQAERFVLSPRHRLRNHLMSQLKKGGVYAHCSNLREALYEYFPYVSEKPIKAGVVIGAAQGQANY